MEWPEAKKNTLAVFAGPHWVHEKFASVLAADTMKAPARAKKGQFPMFKAANLLSSAWAIPSGHKIYLTETCYYYAAIARRMKRIDGRIINIVASPMFYNIWKGGMGKMEAKMLLELVQDVDAMIVEGKYYQGIVESLGLKMPTMLAYTYIGADRYAKLEAMQPNLGTKNLAITATNDIDYKGVDLLLEAMRIVGEQDPEVKLRVIHRNLDMEKIAHLVGENVSFETDVEKTFADTSLYVHPSRGDVFPIAPQEAMLAGIPTMVSTDTGTKEFVENVDGGCVLPLEPKEIAEAILGYFGKTESEKKELSGKFREEARQFNEKEQLSRLESNYAELLKLL